MDKIIITAGKEFEEVLSRTLQGRYEYREINEEQFRLDRQALIDVLAGYQKKALDFDTFSAIFAVLCNVLAKYGVSRNVQDFSLEPYLAVMTSDREKEFLQHLGKAIFCQISGELEQITGHLGEAMQLYPGNYVLSLYNFIYLMMYCDACCIEQEPSDDIKKKIFYAYVALPPDWQEYAVGKGDSIQENKNPAMDSNFLPYVKAGVNYYYKDLLKALCSDKETMEQARVIQRTAKSEAERKDAKRQFELSFEFMKKRVDYFQRHQEAGSQGGLPMVSSESVAGRMARLCLPLRAASIPWIEGYLKQLQLTLQLQQANEEKKKVVRKFSHTYGNMQATTLFEIAQMLLKSGNEESKENGRKLLVEYSLKQNLTKAVYLMRLEFDHDATALKKLISAGVRKIPAGNLRSIVDTAWQRCFLRVFYMNTPLGGSLDYLCDSFEKEVIFEDGSTLSWMQKKIPITLGIDETWEKLYFIPEAPRSAGVLRSAAAPKASEVYGEVFLINMLAEFFYNLLKYADLEKPVGIAFLSWTEDGRNWLGIRTENISRVDRTEQEGEKEGLVSLDGTLTMLNRVVYPEVECSIQVVDQAPKFRLTAMLAAAIFEGEE